MLPKPGSLVKTSAYLAQIMSEGSEILLFKRANGTPIVSPDVHIIDYTSYIGRIASWRGNHQVAVITSLHTQRITFSLYRGWHIVGPLQQLENARADVSLKARPTVSLSPASTLSSLAELPFHFPESPAPMAPSSDDDLPSSIPLPANRSHSKCKSGSALLFDDESDFIAEPGKKKRGWPRKVRSDSEVEEVVHKAPKKKPGPKPKPKAVPKVKPAKKKKTLVSDSESIEMVEKKKPAPPIVLMVPEATSEGSQRLSMLTMTSFEDTLELIHEPIGCVSVVQKPTLAYKLSTAN
ncbi:hypothetical protein B0H14DRAFT_2585033 [Mycena olivaceomarginata]|nr:hypothetical protein B0H14DRAFT_2585033 [Mycena olivaceomarginata]